jgi:hypothetical protein
MYDIHLYHVTIHEYLTRKYGVGVVCFWQSAEDLYTSHSPFPRFFVSHPPPTFLLSISCGNDDIIK